MKALEFKVKKRWWSGAVYIIINLIAFGCVLSPIAGKLILVPIIIILIDLFVIFPDASHYRYIINDKFIIVKRIIYPDIQVPLVTITQINDYNMIAVPGFGVKIIEQSRGGYRIVYSVYKKTSEVIICSPKDPNKFIIELCSRVDKNVNLINNTESAFKTNKNKYLN